MSIWSKIASAGRFSWRMFSRLGRVLNRATKYIKYLKPFAPILAGKVLLLKRIIQMANDIRKRYKEQAQGYYIQLYQSYNQVVEDIRKVQGSAKKLIGKGHEEKHRLAHEFVARMSDKDERKFNDLMKELNLELIDSSAGDAYRNDALKKAA